MSPEIDPSWPWEGEAGALALRIVRFVDGSLAGRTPEPWEALALDVCRWQLKRDPVARSLVDGEPRTADEIPAVPVGVFQDLPVGTCPPEEARATFHTSGTTTSRPGIHRMRSTALYDRASVAFARRVVPGMPPEGLALLASPQDSPHSSLSHMISAFGRALSGRWTWHVQQGQLEPESASERVRGSQGPLFVATTAFALEQWLQQRPPRLPPGSLVMVTGGFKGHQHTLDGPALYAELRGALAPARVVTEYGMTELSSQLWGTPELPYLPPPWLKVTVVDPVSGRPLPQGQPGQLRFFDLCNLDAALGIETMDLGRALPDGTLELLGRLQGAPPRGCSLSVEALRASR